MFTTTKATTSHDKEDTKDKKDEAEGSVAPVVKPVKSLSPAEQAIMDLEKTMGADWYEALQDEFKQSYFRSVRFATSLAMSFDTSSDSQSSHS